MKASRAFPTRWAVFLLVQLVIVSTAIAAASLRWNRFDHVGELPAVREEPLRVEPTYDYPQVISDEQLERVLRKLRPRLRGEKPRINHVDHALRFWGVEAEFADPECLSGEEMRSLLTDHQRFSEAWGSEQPPLLIVDENGVSVRTKEGSATASHYDHTLAGLAEVGTPLSYPILTPEGPATVRNLLEQALLTFKLNQIEYEWSALAFVLYLPPSDQWYSVEGQRVTFDMLADRIMRQPLNQGVCMGNHRLHALVMMLRVDDQVPILSAETRRRIIAHLQDATRRLVASQHEEGSWIRSWPSGVPAEADDPENTLQNRVLVTGHALEWWSLAPREVHPPREVLVRAGQWLARTIEEMDEETVTKNYTYLTHAGRALALWRGRFPARFLRNGEVKVADDAA